MQGSPKHYFFCSPAAFSACTMVCPVGSRAPALCRSLWPLHERAGRRLAGTSLLSLSPVRISAKPREAIFQLEASLRLRSYKDMGNGQAGHLPLKRIMSL